MRTKCGKPRMYSGFSAFFWYAEVQAYEILIRKYAKQSVFGHADGKFMLDENCDRGIYFPFLWGIYRKNSRNQNDLVVYYSLDDYISRKFYCKRIYAWYQDKTSDIV